MKKSAIAAMLAVAIISGLTACGSDGVDTQQDTSADDTQPPETTTTSPNSPDDAAMTYFEAFATATIRDNDEMIGAAADGSMAEDYAIVQTALGSASTSQVPADQTMTVDGDEITLCDDPEDEQTCATYADIEVADNKVTDFTINGEDPRPHLSVGGDPVAVNGVTYTLVGGYETITSGGILYVAYKVQNGTTAALSSNNYSAVYVDAASQQFTATNASGPTEVQPGAEATMLVIFDGPELGGRVITSDSLDDENYTSVEATIPVPAPA